MGLILVLTLVYAGSLTLYVLLDSRKHKEELARGESKYQILNKNYDELWKDMSRRTDCINMMLRPDFVRYVDSTDVLGYVPGDSNETRDVKKLVLHPMNHNSLFAVVTTNK